METQEETSAEGNAHPADNRVQVARHLSNLPDIDLRQMLRMTDDTGMFQHATFGIPDHHHGYCIDDNCRALIAALIHAQLRGYDERMVPVHRYLAFIAYAYNEPERRFRNFMAYERTWLEAVGSDDSHARTLWALGVAIELAPNQMIRGLAHRLFTAALPAADTFSYIRSKAFTLLGLDAFLRSEPENAYARQLREALAEQLHKAWQDNASEDWPWWEDEATYDNAKLCQAMMISGHAMGHAQMRDDAIHALEWLVKVQTGEKGNLSVIGNAGWLQRSGHHAQFDQQPLEAHALCEAFLAAAQITGDNKWVERALWAVRWFYGENDIGQSLYNEETGGCFDGLMPNQVNRNEGAESTLALVLSVLNLHVYRQQIRMHVSVGGPDTVKLGIVGASKFAKFAVEQYDKIPGLQSAAVWSRTESSAHRLAEGTDLKVYSTLEQLAADPQIQMIYIASLPAAHADQACVALSSGKHVLCEKPLATTLGDAYRMVQATVERDRLLAVNFMMRYSVCADSVRQVIASGLMGKVLRGQVVNRASDDSLPPDHWFWDHQLSGGIFIEHGVHFFDLMRSFLGESTVHAAAQFQRPQPEAEDRAIVDQVSCELMYGNECSVSFFHTFTQSHHMDQQTVKLIFEKGQITMHGWVADEMSLHATLSDAELDRLRKLLPSHHTITKQTALEADEKTASRRMGMAHTLDQQVDISVTPQQSSHSTYAKALEELMADFVAKIRDPKHALRSDMHDAVAALELATTADRMAKSAS